MPRGGRPSMSRRAPSPMRGNTSSRASSTNFTSSNPWKSSPTSQTQKGPGLGQTMAQGAALGAGAGIGSSIVHSIFGGFGGRSDYHEYQQNQENMQQLQIQNQQQQQQIEMMKMQNNQQNGQICQNEFKQFLNCVNKNEADLNLCQAFNDVYKNCKVSSGY